MILASALPILQQLSGINTVVFYSSDVSLLARPSHAAMHLRTVIMVLSLQCVSPSPGPVWLVPGTLRYMSIFVWLLRAWLLTSAAGQVRSCLDVQVFAKAGLESPVLGSIIVGAVNVVGTLVAAFLMDQAGRRQLLLVSHVIMTVCLAGLAISTWLPCKHF